jgi:hypothetical protein
MAVEKVVAAKGVEEMVVAAKGVEEMVVGSVEAARAAARGVVEKVAERVGLGVLVTAALRAVGLAPPHH